MVIVEEFKPGNVGIFIVDTTTGQKVHVHIDEVSYVAAALRKAWASKKQEDEA